jgi:hypothetical protein
LRLCFGCHAANRNGQRGGLGRDAIDACGSDARSATIGTRMEFLVVASLECKLRIEEASNTRLLGSMPDACRDSLRFKQAVTP